jgi:hypothetical protein
MESPARTITLVLADDHNVMRSGLRMLLNAGTDFAGGVHGFLPIDKHCRVSRVGGRVFVAGDAANYPINNGGLGAQMADAAASAIAVLAGVLDKPSAFNPVIRGKLRTGAAPVYMSARPIGAESFASEVFDAPPWPADEKVVTEELGPYLARLDAAEAGVGTSS